MIKRRPLVREIKAAPAPELFEVFRRKPFPVLLDSGMDPQRLGRYSFVAADPFLLVRSRGDSITQLAGSSNDTRRGSPFDLLESLLATYKLDGMGLPLAGGAIGYLSYDLCHFIERLPTKAIDDLRFPESYFGFYDVVLVSDNLENKAWLVSSGFPELEETKRMKRARDRLKEVESWLSAGTISSSLNSTVSTSAGVLRSNFTHEEYLKAVSRARDYICAGDIFQVNISQRFQTDLTTPPFELYQRLREVNPAPFAAYLEFDDLAVISASPERFLQVRGDRVETRPIKGTRPRGKTPQEDEVNARELLSSIKDRAENVMIVDLERNDIGRVCRYGTVQVTELAALETYPTVFHLTSTVQGQLREGKTRVDLLRASFPGGSITGAPKVRSMEIIDELEPTRRSVYTGSIGYLSFGGDMDLSIVIRTILASRGKACFQVGGGIVYDSEPEAEYQETLDKARALVRALSLCHAGTIEIQS